jgi:SAM-dependent methyltransferase
MTSSVGRTPTSTTKGWKEIVRPIQRYLFGTEQHWARVVMDRETDRYIRGLDFPSLQALEISGSKWATYGFRTYRSAKYPAYDWCAGPLDEKFDIILAEQVLEHLPNPRAALQNAHAMLHPGGLLVVTTPFLIRIHEYPIDCSRWTPLGLRHLLNECGFPNVETGAWGNRRCVRANFSQWARYIPWRHSLRNEVNFPVVVWAFARPLN